MIEACQKKDTILRLNNTDIFIKINFSLNIKLEVQGMLTIFSISIVLEKIFTAKASNFWWPSIKRIFKSFWICSFKSKNLLNFNCHTRKIHNGNLANVSVFFPFPSLEKIKAQRRCNQEKSVASNFIRFSLKLLVFLPFYLLTKWVIFETKNKIQ